MVLGIILTVAILGLILFIYEVINAEEYDI